MLACITAAAGAGAAVSYCRCLHRWCKRRRGAGGPQPAPRLPSPSRSGGVAAARGEDEPEKRRRRAFAHCCRPHCSEMGAAVQQPRGQTRQGWAQCSAGRVSGGAGCRCYRVSVEFCCISTALADQRLQCGKFDSRSGSMPAAAQHAWAGLAGHPSRAGLPLHLHRRWIL